MKERMKIEIPRPCNAAWDSMTPSGDGRHCGMCDKVVVDFTSMKTEELCDYLLKNAGKRTCGHINKGQLKQDKNKFQAAVYNLYCDSSLKIKSKYIRYVALFFLGSLLTISGCSTTTQGELMIEPIEQIKDTVPKMPVDTLKGNIKHQDK